MEEDQGFDDRQRIQEGQDLLHGNRDEMEPSTSAADDAETEPSASTEADDGSGEEADACADELPEEFSVLFVLDSEELGVFNLRSRGDGLDQYDAKIYM